MKKIFKLEHFLYFSILALPSYLIKISFFGVPTNLFEILAVVAMAWYAIELRRLKIELGEYKRYFIPIGLILGGLVLATVINGVYGMGLGIIKGWFVIPIIFALVVVKKLKAKDIFRAVYDGAFLVAAIGLMYFLADKLTYDGRLAAIYNSPNYLAMALAPAMIIGLRFWAENKKYYTFSLAIILGAMYLTFSYAAWIAIFVVSLISMFEKRRFFLQKVLGLVVAIVLIFFSQIGNEKLQSVLQIEERSSASSRLMIWQAAQKIGRDNLWWGVGPGNFQAKYLEYQQYFPLYLEWAVPHPHNILLAFWLQAGLMGLVGFLWLLFLWTRDLFQMDNKNIQWLSGLILLYILLHGMMDTTYFKNDLAVIFWLVFFVAISHVARERRDVILLEDRL